MTRRPLAALRIAVLLSVPACLAAQTTQDEVPWFQSTSQDARVAPASYLEGNLFSSGYPGGSYRIFGALVGVVPSPKLEVNVAIQYSSPSASFSAAGSGLTDPVVHAKYNFGKGATRLAAGAFVTVPIGSEEVGEGDLDAGIFLAARHPIGPRTTVGGRISADYFEFEKEGDPSVRLAAGVLQQVADKLTLLGEVLVMTHSATTANLTGGVDYAVGPRSHLRAALGFGLNDRGPDRVIYLGVLHSFRR